jgi:hypothetical protein
MSLFKYATSVRPLNFEFHLAQSGVVPVTPPARRASPWHLNWSPMNRRAALDRVRAVISRNDAR